MLRVLHRVNVRYTVTVVARRWRYDQWEDGAGGQEWKSRDLDEKRTLATEFLTNINQRVPIHNAIRERCIAQSKVIEDCTQSAHNVCTAVDESQNNDVEGALRSIQDGIDELASDEYINDTLKYITPNDATLLDDELLRDGEDSRILRSWLKHRRRTADYQSYISIPEKEASMWSAWYLRHVQGNADNTNN